MAIIGAASRAAQPLGAGWQLEHAVAILANVLGVGVAVKLRARLTAFVLGVTAIAQLAEYPMHLQFGIDTVQGGPTKLALIVAAALGLGFSVFVRRRTLSSGVLAQPADVKASEPEFHSRTQAEQSRSLTPSPV
jgi:hypothetical protein